MAAELSVWEKPVEHWVHLTVLSMALLMMCLGQFGISVMTVVSE